MITVNNKIPMLQHTLEASVRFSEADPLGIVWHGHYVRYFEDGREGFGREYGFSYMDFYKHGLAVPIVSLHCSYKKPLRYGDSMIIRTTYVPAQATKIEFRYDIFDVLRNELVASGSSTQVLVDKDTFELHLTAPPFLEAWRAAWKV